VRPYHVAIRVEVRLGVDLRGRTKGRPSQLDDAPAAHHLIKVQPLVNLIDLAYIFTQGDGVIFVDRGTANRVVTTIGQSAARFNQDRPQFLFVFGDDAENPTHI